MEQTTDQPESKTDYFFFKILNIKLAHDFNTTLRDWMLEMNGRIFFLFCSQLKYTHSCDISQ